MSNNKTLKVPIKKEFFDMILSGEKPEEYRELKPYWDNKLIHYNKGFRPYDYVEFTNGYGDSCPQITVEWKGTKIGFPNLAWCGQILNKPYEKVYVISLGNLVSFKNLNKQQNEIARNRVGGS